MGMDQLEIDGRIPECIFVGDSDWNPVCTLQSSSCTLEPWKILQQPHPIHRDPGQLPSVYHQLKQADVPTSL